jgi:hypothetical protein
MVLPPEVRRARSGPGLWPGPCRQARWVGRGLQGQRRAAGASRAAGCEAPLRLEEPTRTMRGVPTPMLWPFIKRLPHSAHDDRPGQLAERMTHGTLRRGALRPGAGHRRGGQRLATGALPRKRERARLPATCGESPPRPSPPHRVTLPLVHALRARPAHPRELRPEPVGVARRRCALEAVRKVVTDPSAVQLSAVQDGRSGSAWRPSIRTSDGHGEM